MLVIGLTGGIGSGKTTVADLFAKLGVPIIDADQVARDVTQPGQAALALIVEHFNQALLLADGTLNRAALRQLIFKDEAERHWLENLLHPLIQEEILRQLDKLSAPYCIVVIPLLFETAVNFDSLIDRILLVDAAETRQIERVKARDQLSSAEIQAILNSQVEREYRLKHCDDVIINDGELGELMPQVEKLHAYYLGLMG